MDFTISCCWAQASGTVAPPVRGFWLFETAPQGLELPLIGHRFRELREDDAPVLPNVACEVTVSPRTSRSGAGVCSGAPGAPWREGCIAAGPLPSEKITCEVEVLPDIQVSLMSLGKDVPVLPTSVICDGLMYMLIYDQ